MFERNLPVYFSFIAFQNLNGLHEGKATESIFHTLLMDTEKTFSLLEQFPCPFSRCDHSSWFIQLELQRDDDSPHSD